MNKFSLKDIAKAAGVSITTVSLVINNKSEKGRISETVVERVKKVIKDYNYHPNIIARSLRTGKSNTIGLIVEDVSDHFFATIAKTVEYIAYQNGYKVLTVSTDNNGQRAHDLLKMMQVQQVEGLIITPTACLKSDIEKMVHSKKPLVLFDRYFPGLDASHVVLDNFKGAYDMTELLLKKGYQHIAFITVSDQMNQMQDRLDGYQQALLANKVSTSNHYILEFPFDSTKEKKLKLLENYLKKNSRIEALFFATNYLGNLGVEYMRNKKINISKDMGLCSFDDNELFKLLSPAITVVAQPVEKLAKEVMRILFALINQSAEEKVQVSLPPEIIERSSLIK